MWTKLIGISRQPFSVQILIDQKQLENLEYFNYLGTMTASDSRYRRKIYTELPWEKQHSTSRNFFSPANCSLNLRKGLFKSYHSSRALESGETLTLWKIYP
jgi:hypothetical protein